MQIIVGLVSVALTVAIALILIMSFAPLKRIVGLGELSPTGVPAAITRTGAA